MISAMHVVCLTRADSARRSRSSGPSILGIGVAASTAALAYALEPCFAIGFAALLLHESATRWQLAGGALVVLSNLLASIL